MALFAWLATNVPLAVWMVWWMFLRGGPEPIDWQVWVEAARDVGTPHLYDDLFIFSPLVAWAFAIVVVPIGWPALMAAHFAVLPVLQDRRIVLVVLTCAGFWMDTLAGTLFLFVAATGVLAMRGSRPAALAFVALCMLMPRPVQVPLAVWLLLRDRRLWLPAAAIVSAAAVASAWTGHLTEWIVHMLSVGSAWPASSWDLGPTRLFGLAWLLVGVPLAVLLVVRGHPGWAGLAMSPYLAPQYLLALLWEPRLLRWVRGKPR